MPAQAQSITDVIAELGWPDEGGRVFSHFQRHLYERDGQPRVA